MTVTFLIPASGINTMFKDRHLHLAPGIRYSTDNREVARFLAAYPGVETIATQLAEPAQPIQPGQFSHAGDQPVVVSGGFSGGGAAAIASKKPMGR